MRKLTLVFGMVASIACGGVSKEQYGAKEAEAAKYKQGVQDEAGKAAALESKVQSLEQQNAALQTQAADLQRRLAETTTAKSQLENTTARLSQQSAELKGRQAIRLDQQLLFA